MTAELLLVSDLDDTFLGDRAALHRFAEYFPAVRRRIEIVYASGRFVRTIHQDIGPS